MNKKNRKNREKREKCSRERGTKKKAKILRISFLDHNSSLKVGYGFYAIHSKLLIANDMNWVVL